MDREARILLFPACRIRPVGHASDQLHRSSNDRRMAQRASAHLARKRLCDLPQRELLEVRRNRAMNFLLVNYEYPPIGGGAGNSTMFIAKALHMLGHSASVLTSAYAGNAGIQDDEGVHVSRVRVSRRSPDRAGPAEMLSFVRA